MKFGSTRRSLLGSMGAIAGGAILQRPERPGSQPRILERDLGRAPSPTSSVDSIAPNWTFLTNDIVGAPIIVRGDLVLAATFAGDIHALDANSGDEVWNYQADDAIGGLAGTENSLLFASQGSRKLTSIAVETGEVLWVSDVLAAWDSVQPRGDRIFCGTATDAIVAVNQADGTLIWNYHAGDAVYGEVIAADGSVFATTRDGNIHAVEATSGELQWSTTFSDSVGPVRFADNGLVIVSDSAGSGTYFMRCLDAKTGEQIWSRQSDSYQYGSELLLNDHLVYVEGNKPAGIDTKVNCLNVPSREISWSTPIDVSVASCDPMISNDLIYIGPFGFNPETGTIVTELEVADGAICTETLVVNGNTAFIGTWFSTIHSFSLPR